eukprot:6189447-Pleurochrysis_carterae.AAC.1
MAMMLPMRCHACLCVDACDSPACARGVRPFAALARPAHRAAQPALPASEACASNRKRMRILVRARACLCARARALCVTRPVCHAP